MIPFMDFGRVNTLYIRQVRRNIQKCVLDSRFILGGMVERFEAKWADYCGSAYCISVASGTDALVLSLLALGLRSGDYVVTTPVSFVATVQAILRVGATPLFVDIDDYNSGSLCLETLEKLLDSSYFKRKIKAVVPVHLYGQPCDMEYLMELSKLFDFFVVEDTCQSHGPGDRTVREV